MKSVVDIPVPRGYRAVEELHRGSRSLLWRAQRSRDGLPVVLKAAAGHPPSPSQHARIAAEFEILQQIGHEHVISPIELAQTDDGPVLVLEHFDGTALSRQRTGPWPVTEVLDIGERIANALASLHASKIAHRDITPYNILRDPASGMIKIVDFASAVKATGKHWPAIQPELSPESLHYAAPEQTWYAERRVDQRADLYSFGVTLFQLLTGTVPFGDASAAELARCHALEKPPAVEKQAPDVPLPLAQLVAALLAKEPGLRFPSTSQLYETLAEYRRQWLANGELEPTEDAMQAAADAADAARIATEQGQRLVKKAGIVESSPPLARLPESGPRSVSEDGSEDASADTAADESAARPNASSDTSAGEASELPPSRRQSGQSLSEYLDESVDSDDPSLTARFALTASNRALEALDYSAARDQAERGIAALPPDAFRTHYELAFNLHYALCEASCALEVDLEELEGMCVALSDHARTRLERMMITTLRVWQLGSRGESRRAVDIGLDEMEELGFTVRDQPLDTLLPSLWGKIQSRIGLRSLRQVLESLEPSRDPELNAATELFMALGFPLWVLDPAQMSVLSMYMALATLSKGTTPGSGLALASAGIAIVHGIGDRDRGRKFGKAGIALAERLGHYVDETRQLVAEFIDNPSLGRPPEGAEAAAQTGDTGQTSKRSATAATSTDDQAGSASQDDGQADLAQASTSAPGPAPSDGADGPQQWYQRAIGMCDAIRGEVEQALWDRLAELPTLMERLEKYKESEPTFASRYHMVCAEVARVYGDLLTAEGHYEHAISLAREKEQLHDEARANELAGCFFRDRNMLTPARAYLEEARAGYQACGAVAKAAAMEQEYSSLLHRGRRKGRERKSERGRARKSSSDGDSSEGSSRSSGESSSRKRTARKSSRSRSATQLASHEIEAALEAHDGVVSHAAKELGVSRQSLYRRMKKLGLKAPGR